jgi:hypothetical protein
VVSCWVYTSAQEVEAIYIVLQHFGHFRNYAALQPGRPYPPQSPQSAEDCNVLHPLACKINTRVAALEPEVYCLLKHDIFSSSRQLPTFRANILDPHLFCWHID